MLEIKTPREITILSNKFQIIYDPKTSGGEFSFSKGEIVIGSKWIKEDPGYTPQIISHEVMEVILVLMGGRFDHPRLENTYLFNFSHQTFENAIQIHTETMLHFINTTKTKR